MDPYSRSPDGPTVGLDIAVVLAAPGWRAACPHVERLARRAAAAGAASVLVMPELISSTSSEFGTIGAAFAVVAWLTGLAMVLMVSAAGGATIADWRRQFLRERAAAQSASTSA